MADMCLKIDSDERGTIGRIDKEQKREAAVRRRFGCLFSVIGIIVVAAGIFSWQLASDSPEWNLATLFRVVGIADIIIGAALMLFGFFRLRRPGGSAR